jgi:hypothetical protein
MFNMETCGMGGEGNEKKNPKRGIIKETYSYTLKLFCPRKGTLFFATLWRCRVV